MLERLGLVERTGVTEPSEEIIGLDKETGDLRDVPRAGELRLDPARGFRERSYIRLTPGAEARVEWVDPVGYISLIYPDVRRKTEVLPTEVPPSVGPSAAEGEQLQPPRQVRSPRTATETVERLERQRVLLRRLAADAQAFNTLEEFEVLLEQARAYQTGVRARYRRNPFPALAGGVTLLEQCVNRLEHVPRGIRFDQAAWLTAIDSCQAAARVMGESIGTPLRGTVEPVFDEEEESEQLSPGQLLALWTPLVERIYGWVKPSSINAERLICF